MSSFRWMLPVVPIREPECLAIIAHLEQLLRSAMQSPRDGIDGDDDLGVDEAIQGERARAAGMRGPEFETRCRESGGYGTDAERPRLGTHAPNARGWRMGQERLY